MSQDRKNTLAELESVISGLTETVRELAQQEEEKAAAASERKHEQLDGFIHQEQALLMKIKGLEQRRTELLGQLGWESLTFRQILSQAEENEKNHLEPLFISLDAGISRLKHSHEAANRILTTRIYELQMFLARTQAEAGNASGESSHSAFHSSRIQDTYV